MNKIDVEKAFNYWTEASEKDFETMLHLFQSKDFHWSLFIGHLVLERLLKASIVKHTGEHSKYTHSLTRLAEDSNLYFSTNQLDELDTISTYNLNARYDTYKQEFYKMCTFEYTLEWIEKIKELRKWIKERQYK